MRLPLYASAVAGVALFLAMPLPQALVGTVCVVVPVGWATRILEDLQEHRRDDGKRHSDGPFPSPNYWLSARHYSDEARPLIKRLHMASFLAILGVLATFVLGALYDFGIFHHAK